MHCAQGHTVRQQWSTDLPGFKAWTLSHSTLRPAFSPGPLSSSAAAPTGRLGPLLCIDDYELGLPLSEEGTKVSSS